MLILNDTDLRLAIYDYLAHYELICVELNLTKQDRQKYTVKAHCKVAGDKYMRLLAFDLHVINMQVYFPLL